MNNQPTTSKSGALSRLSKATFSTGLLAASVFLLSGNTSQAGSATWKANPTSRNWNTAANWTPTTVPNGLSDTATFDFSNTTDVALSASTEVSGIVFNAGASAFTINVSTDIPALLISGVGITNNSGVAQNIVNPGSNKFDSSSYIVFTNNATAGTGIFFTNHPAGFIQLGGTSSAGNGSFTNLGATVSGAGGGSMDFYGSATAANGSFTGNGGSVSGAFGGGTAFQGNSTAGKGTFTANGATVSNAGGGVVVFYDKSSAASATLIANGGLNGGGAGAIYFFELMSRGAPSGGTARVKVFGNGNLDISSILNARGVTVGSIEGDGVVFLGARNLTIGSNNLSTNFSGVITDRGGITDGRGGSLTKIGTGKLVLSHRNFYPGGTTVNRGRLVVNNIGGSGTGSGPVQVNRGKLGGKGEIAGAVTVGTGTGFGAVLAPGYLHGMGSPGALTIQSPLTFNSDATYEVGMNSSSVMRDEVVALGVTINGGAQFAFVDIGSGSLPAGTIFTVINNTAATPIAGTFSNLPDGSTFASNGNSFKANYQGGDGNDLTLKVVP